MTPKLPEPNACYWCDQPQHGHAQRWAACVGFHGWIAPPDGMRLARLKARRNDRLAVAL